MIRMTILVVKTTYHCLRSTSRERPQLGVSHRYPPVAPPTNSPSSASLSVASSLRTKSSSHPSIPSARAKSIIRRPLSQNGTVRLGKALWFDARIHRRGRTNSHGRVGCGDLRSVPRMRAKGEDTMSFDVTETFSMSKDMVAGATSPLYNGWSENGGRR